jgi:hypothetical protein
MDELLGALFALLSVRWLYIEDQLPGAYPVPWGK